MKLLTNGARPEGPAPESVAPKKRADKVGFARTLSSEWTKLRTVRSTMWTLAVLTALVPVMAVFVGATGSLQPDDTIVGGSLTGAALGQIGAAIFGVLMMSGEYSTGMIRNTLSATPRRGTVLGAKALILVTMMFVAGLIACSAGYQIGTMMLSSDDYAAGEPWPALLGVALSFSAAGALGLAIATILRHSSGAITASLGIILLPSLLGPLFGSWQTWVAGASPTAALQKLTQSSDAAPDIAGSLGPWPSLWLVCGYAALALGVGAWRLRSRDA